MCLEWFPNGELSEDQIKGIFELANMTDFDESDVSHSVDGQTEPLETSVNEINRAETMHQHESTA